MTRKEQAEADDIERAKCAITRIVEGYAADKRRELARLDEMLFGKEAS